MSDYTGIRRIDSLIENAEEISERSNRTRRAFLLHADRYLFDFNLDIAEWAQLDTESDASYFGVWLSKTKLRILKYVEGDVIFVQCADAACYDAEIAALCAFHKASPAFVVIEDEAVTPYYQDRSDLFINPPEAPKSDT